MSLVNILLNQIIFKHLFLKLAFKFVLVSTLCEIHFVPMAYETCCLSFYPSNDIKNKTQRCLQYGWCKDKVGVLFGPDLHPYSTFHKQTTNK